MTETITNTAAWQVQQLRVTSIIDPKAVSFEYMTWWRTLVGSEPDSIIDQPKQTLHQERGKIDEQNVLALQVLPPRIDWVLLPSEEESGPPAGRFVFIGSFPSILTDFVDLMRRWLPSCPATARFALGGVLLQPQPDKASGYVRLKSYLPGVELDAASSDFMYQINRPRLTTTSVPMLQINRLTKWSVAFTRRFAMAVGKESTSVSDLGEQFACRLEFDLNTAADFKGPLPDEKLPDLLSEFVDLTIELAERGDRP